MSAADECATRLSRIYTRAVRPHELEVTTLELLKALIALAYSEGVEAGARQIPAAVSTSFDETIKHLTEIKRNGDSNEPV